MAIYLFLFRLRLRYYDRFVVLPYPRKRQEILIYARKFGCKCFIETGTFLGDTLEFLKNDFARLVSIELSTDLASRARKRFSDFGHIAIIQGDSGLLLRDLLKELSEPCLFWLDGHYSTEFWHNGEYFVTAKGEHETPILQELDAILQHRMKNHVVLVDDARLFKGKGDYPKISALRQIVKELNPSYKLRVRNDIIRITPRRRHKSAVAP